MTEMIKVKIKVLVGSNGKVSACTERDLDWGDLADNIADWDGGTCRDPEASARYFVEVEVPLPETKTIAGKAVAA